MDVITFTAGGVPIRRDAAYTPAPRYIAAGPGPVAPVAWPTPVDPAVFVAAVAQAVADVLAARRARTEADARYPVVGHAGSIFL